MNWTLPLTDGGAPITGYTVTATDQTTVEPSSAGAPGHRLALPNSLVVIHQPWAQGMQGQATDLDVHAREILRQRALLIELYHRHTGRDSEQIGRDIERDYHMTAEQALAYGMVDHIIEKRPAGALAGNADLESTLVPAGHERSHS